MEEKVKDMLIIWEGKLPNKSYLVMERRLVRARYVSIHEQNNIITRSTYDWEYKNTTMDIIGKETEYWKYDHSQDSESWEEFSKMLLNMYGGQILKLLS